MSTDEAPDWKKSDAEKLRYLAWVADRQDDERGVGKVSPRREVQNDLQRIAGLLETQATKLDRLRAENERLSGEIEPIVDSVRLKKFEAEEKDGKYNLHAVLADTTENGVLRAMAQAMVEMLDGMDAPNYVEAEVKARGIRSCTMTVRWSEKPTPHDLRLKAEAERDSARATIEAVRKLHKPEKRWQDHPDSTYSWDTREEALDEIDGDGEPTFFEVCSHCGEIEHRFDEEGDYRESLWPCATVRALGGPE